MRLVRRVITRLVEDVIGETERRLVALKPASAADIRAGRSRWWLLRPCVEAESRSRAFSIRACIATRG
jgi:dGTPase